MMSRLGFPLYIVLSVLAFAGSPNIHAQNIAVPLGDQGNTSIQTPNRAWTQTQVQESYGAPLNRRGPLGDPAITVWEYAQFSVYFEHDRVLHSVKHYSAQN